MKKVAVVMAGGGGLRLWPLSSPERPKHMLRLFSDASLLKETVDRITTLAEMDNVWIVTNRELVRDVVQETGIAVDRVLSEPLGKNTAPAVALAAHHLLEKEGEDTIMMVLPSDHYIQPLDLFVRTMNKACQVAEGGWLTTLGIPPSRPETGYGYMETGEVFYASAEESSESGEETCDPRSLPALKVLRFVEKPSLDRALKFMEKGNFYWNSGIFVWKVGVIWEALVRHLPEVALALDKIKGASSERRESLLGDLYARFPNISIDYAVMEKSRRVAMVPAPFEWCDLGSWTSLWEVMEKDAKANVLKGSVDTMDVGGSIIWSQGGVPIKVIGMEGVVVVATGHGVLVCPLERSQEVKKLLGIQ